MAARVLYFTLLAAVFTIFTSAQFTPLASSSAPILHLQGRRAHLLQQSLQPNLLRPTRPGILYPSIDYACKKLTSTPANGNQQLYRNQLLRLPQSSLRQRDRPIRSPDPPRSMLAELRADPRVQRDHECGI